MLVCLFFPFENLELEVVTPEDEQLITGYRVFVINSFIKFKMNATNAINNIINKKPQ